MEVSYRSGIHMWNISYNRSGFGGSSAGVASCWPGHFILPDAHILCFPTPNSHQSRSGNSSWAVRGLWKIGHLWLGEQHSCRVSSSPALLSGALQGMSEWGLRSTSTKMKCHCFKVSIFNCYLEIHFPKYYLEIEFWCLENAVFSLNKSLLFKAYHHSWVDRMINMLIRQPVFKCQ